MDATPLIYDSEAATIGYAARTVIFTVTVTGLTVSMLTLKQLLVRAERPTDATDPNDLVRAADERLLARKRERRRPEAEAAPV